MISASTIVANGSPFIPCLAFPLDKIPRSLLGLPQFIVLGVSVPIGDCSGGTRPPPSQDYMTLAGRED